MKYDTQTPFIASYMIVRRGDKIAFVLRKNTSWMNGYYGLPSGKVEKNENYTRAAARESLEEIGIKVAPENLRFVYCMHRNNDKDKTQWVDVFFEVEKWSNEPHNAEPHMHGELTWMDLKNLPENVLPYVKFALEQIKAGKTYSEYGWTR